MIFDYFRQNPKVGVFILILAIAVIILWCKVLKDRAKHNEENNALLEKLKEENKLRAQFKALSKELADNADEISLFRGVSLNLQKRISDCVDMEGEFASLTDEQRMIYAMSFVVEDGEKGLSGFFSQNGKPLTDEAKKFVEKILPAQAVNYFNMEYDAYDGDNEEVSFVEKEIKSNDELFFNEISIDGIMKLGGKFIRDNIDCFITENESRQ